HRRAKHRTEKQNPPQPPILHTVRQWLSPTLRLAEKQNFVRTGARVEVLLTSIGKLLETIWFGQSLVFRWRSSQRSAFVSPSFLAETLFLNRRDLPLLDSSASVDSLRLLSALSSPHAIRAKRTNLSVSFSSTSVFGDHSCLSS